MSVPIQPHPKREGLPSLSFKAKTQPTVYTFKNPYDQWRNDRLLQDRNRYITCSGCGKEVQWSRKDIHKKGKVCKRETERNNWVAMDW